MYIAPGQGQTNPWGQMLMSTESPYHFPFLQVSKESLWSMILNTFLNDFIHVYSPGQGQTTPRGQNFDVNRNSVSQCPFVASLKKISEVWFFYCFFFMCFFYMYIAPGRGRQTIGDKNFITTERPLLFAHMLQVSKWSLRNLISYILMILFMYIAAGQEQKAPWGQTFDVNRKPLSLHPFVASFKQISLNSDFLHIF